MRKDQSGTPWGNARAPTKRVGTTVAITAPTRKRRLLTILLVATALVAGLALTPMAARAVHDEGLFELDGNIVDSPAVTGQDWSAFQGLWPRGTAPISTVFISDGFNGVNDSIYFGGGSQNNNDITSWRWSRRCLDQERHRARFASAYIKNDQLFLYFGGDRYDPTGGTTNIGFWFLQDGGALEGGSGCPDSDPATNEFSGSHVNGDLFVFAEFAGGGGDSGVSIYEWLNGSLHLLAAKAPARSAARTTALRPQQQRDDCLDLAVHRQPGLERRWRDPRGRIRRGRHQPELHLRGPRQGSALRQPLPRPDGQLASDTRPRGFRGWLVQRLLEADRRQGHSER